MQGRPARFTAFYCYVEKITGKKIVTTTNTEKSDGMEYFYVAACPNESIARTVYDRHLALVEF